MVLIKTFSPVYCVWLCHPIDLIRLVSFWWSICHMGKRTYRNAFSSFSFVLALSLSLPPSLSTFSFWEITLHRAHTAFSGNKSIALLSWIECTMHYIYSIHTIHHNLITMVRMQIREKILKSAISLAKFKCKAMKRIFILGFNIVKEVHVATARRECVWERKKKKMTTKNDKF